jgi:hypothetical protein
MSYELGLLNLPNFHNLHNFLNFLPDNGFGILVKPS